MECVEKLILKRSSISFQLRSFTTRVLMMKLDTHTYTHTHTTPNTYIHPSSSIIHDWATATSSHSIGDSRTALIISKPSESMACSLPPSLARSLVLLRYSHGNTTLSERRDTVGLSLCVAFSSSQGASKVDRIWNRPQSTTTIYLTISHPSIPSIHPSVRPSVGVAFTLVDPCWTLSSRVIK